MQRPRLRPTRAAIIAGAVTLLLVAAVVPAGVTSAALTLYGGNGGSSLTGYNSTGTTQYFQGRGGRRGRGGDRHRVAVRGLGARAHGIVTGGTGTFTGATGIITAKPANKTGTNSAFSITYTS
jgi:hypothetical protein